MKFRYFTHTWILFLLEFYTIVVTMQTTSKILLRKQIKSLIRELSPENRMTQSKSITQKVKLTLTYINFLFDLDIKDFSFYLFSVK